MDPAEYPSSLPSQAAQQSPAMPASGAPLENTGEPLSLEKNARSTSDSYGLLVMNSGVNSGVNGGVNSDLQ